MRHPTAVKRYAKDRGLTITPVRHNKHEIIDIVDPATGRSYRTALAGTPQDPHALNKAKHDIDRFFQNRGS